VAQNIDFVNLSIGKPPRKTGYFTRLFYPSREKGINMEIILKLLGFFIGLFVIVNGLWVYAMPPTGDEPQGLAIIAIGIFIPAIILYVSRLDDKREA
jgi:hypothetical protein